MPGDEPSAGADDEDVGEDATSEEPPARSRAGGSPGEDSERDAAVDAPEDQDETSASDDSSPEEGATEPEAEEDGEDATVDEEAAAEEDGSKPPIEGDDDGEAPAEADEDDGAAEADDGDGTDELDDADLPAETDDDAAADEEDDEDDGAWGYFSGGDGPEEDREMPLAEHIEEMLKRLAVIVAIAGAVSLVVLPIADQIVNFLWYSIMPGVPSEIARPRVYGILEKLFTEIKVASLAGLIVALPVLVYQVYAFMRPGLYPHERRYYLAAVPTSLILALVGVSFAFFVILPAIFTYFLYYSQDVATIGFALGRTFDLILLLMGYMALVFQIPLFIMLAMMMGLVTRAWLAARRLLFWGAFLGISFLFSPDPTGMAPIVVAATMIVLFEGTLLLTKWTGRE